MQKNYDIEILSIDKNGDETEKTLIERLLEYYTIDASSELRIKEQAKGYVAKIRKGKATIVESFMQEYGLSNEEGVAIMCVAESLLRIPDEYIAQELISDKILNKNWRKHSGHSDSLFVNASTWGLFLTGKILSFKESDFDLSKLVGRLGENMILKVLKKAIHTIANTFIIGHNIESGVKSAAAYEERKQRLSYDILGESSRNIDQVEHYYNQYIEAIEVIAKHKKFDDCFKNPSLSVKLSALHPRFELLQKERVFSELLPRVGNIVRLCMEKNIAITFDAEEASRLNIYLIFIAKLISDPEFTSYNGIGFVVQAYQKRAFFVLDFIIELAKTYKKQIPIRLVKGAYWDSEIKNAQELGLKDYPVFTKKEFTDVSYLACAKKILVNKGLIYPQFATHNAYTIAAIQDMAFGIEFEFQKLYGMGDMLHSVVAEHGYTSRIYAPVGKYQDLLAYLMRRLLENGANTSFLNIVNQKDNDITAIIETPRLAAIKSLNEESKIPTPQHIFKSGRANSIGYDLGFQLELDNILKGIQSVDISKIALLKKHSDRPNILVTNPANPKEILAELPSVNESEIDSALKSAKQYFPSWSSKNVNERANILLKIGDLLHENRHTLYALLIKEAGKNIKDSIGEVREAIDFARYYAKKAVDLMLNGIHMDGYTGESNTLKLHPKGVFVCISPWNFPLAIFCGQIFAALVSGNTVIAKPSEITSLIALYTTDLMYKAGIPKEALHLLLGSGSKIGGKLASSDSVAGFCFTGSTNVARIINRTLAARDAAIATFIAETGGQNAMIVDSSTLLEQASDAILTSAFGSIGQRCSALRVVYIQEEIYEPLIKMLSGALNEIKIGNTMDFSNDLGPVISASAKKQLEVHIHDMQQNNFEIIAKHTTTYEDGYFLAPHIIKINSILDLKEENFGPILHVIPYQSKDLDRVIDEINGTGFGLTFGIQSRIERKFMYIANRIMAGNTYVNRSTIGAQVESHPFGGECNSGTGFKAGGPHYLLKFLTERTVTINQTAIGGNFQLLSE